MAKIKVDKTYIVGALYNKALDPRADHTAEERKQIADALKTYFTETANTLVAIGNAKVPGVKVVDHFTSFNGSITVLVRAKSPKSIEHLRRKLGPGFTIGVNGTMHSCG